MTFAITRADLEQTVGAEQLLTVPEDRLHPVVTHGPCRTFLAEVGLPDLDEELFQVDDGLAGGGREGRESGAGILDDVQDPPAERLLLIGWFWNDGLFLDGGTGKLWVANDSEGVFQFLNSGIDLFTRFTTALIRDHAVLSPDQPDEVRAAAADNLRTELRALDPEAFADLGAYWYKAIDNLATDY